MKTYALTHHAYCGMAVPMGEGDYSDMRAKAAQVLKRRRNQGYPVSRIALNQWEIESRDDDAMVSDHCGILALVEVKPRTVECRECGSDVELGESCDCQQPIDADGHIDDCPAWQGDTCTCSASEWL